MPLESILLPGLDGTGDVRTAAKIALSRHAAGALGLAAVTLLAACAPTLDLRPHDDHYAACGRRAAGASPNDSEAVVGTIHQINDATPVDGPVSIVVIDPAGAPRKLFFGSLYTLPAPSEARQATYRAIAPSQVGDCVRARGNRMDDGRLSIEQFENFDHPAKAGDSER